MPGNSFKEVKRKLREQKRAEVPVEEKKSKKSKKDVEE